MPRRCRSCASSMPAATRPSRAWSRFRGHRDFRPALRLEPAQLAAAARAGRAARRDGQRRFPPRHGDDLAFHPHRGGARRSDGWQPRRARLVIAADGRNSPMRQAAGIDVATTRFGQKALAFAVTHPIPHGNVSTEIHRTGGPFTLVPLPDHDGRPPRRWSGWRGRPNANALMELDTPAFEAAMSERSCHLFGPLTLASRRGIWPIIAQTASASRASGWRWWPRPRMSCRRSGRRG